MSRIKQALEAGFRHLVFEDNYDTGTGDHYSLRHICDQFYIRGACHPIWTFTFVALLANFLYLRSFSIFSMVEILAYKDRVENNLDINLVLRALFPIPFF